jgi:hypothetical protein
MKSDPCHFRGFGYLAIGFAVLWGVLVLSNLRSWLTYNGPNYSPLGLISVYWGALGVGLVYMKKWAVALFVLSLSSIGIFVVLRAIFETPFPSALLYIAFGLALCMPFVPALRYWHDLK